MSSEATPSGKHGNGPVRDHERSDANAKWIFAVVIFLFISAMAMHGIVVGFLSALKQGPGPTDFWRPLESLMHAGPKRPPFPVLQVSPSADLNFFRKKEQAQLETYGWINRTSGIVRVPIERAMELVLNQGLPARTNRNTNAAGPSSYQLIQQRPEHREQEINPEYGR